jgi:D-lactate dehydrogenase (cytochrome)
MKQVHNKHDIETEYKDYLRDESRMEGQADIVAFPETEEDLQTLMAQANKEQRFVTVQGARTGITGGAVSQGGMVVSCVRMNRFLGLRQENEAFYLRLQPGVLLADLRKAVAACDFDTEDWSATSLQALAAMKEMGPWFFSPDPTEDSASLGGMVACNASGACTFRYGSTRNHVAALRVVLSDGQVLTLKRGDPCAEGRSFTLQTEQGRLIQGVLPDYRMPAVKSAAGYFVEDNVDLVDLFIGAEGTLGVVSEIEVRLLPRPEQLCGVVAFFDRMEDALSFVVTLREKTATKETGRPAAMEWFDEYALNLLRTALQESPGMVDIPELKDRYRWAVYVEFHEHSEEALDDAIVGMCEILEACGGNEDWTWIAMDDHEQERLKAFRHAVPETVNSRIDQRRKQYPNLTKLGTDMSVPDDKLAAVMSLYRDGLAKAGLEYVIFGHVGNNHVHVNILPRDPAEYQQGKALYLEWANTVVGWGGSVSAEHGIGKLKVRFLETMYGIDGVNSMRQLKRLFDPDERLNRGNLFQQEEACT